MLRFIREYFSFSKGERNGILILLALMFLLIAAQYSVRYFAKTKTIDFSAFQQEIAEFEKQIAGNEKPLAGKENTDGAPVLFNFDPNELPAEGWKKLGLDEKTVRIILNYRNKGGHFFEQEDLLKIYGFDTAKYEQLQPYIQIAEEEREMMNPLEKSVYKPAERKERRTDFTERRRQPEKEPAIVELNSADSAQLVSVNGIGPVLSKRILKYRDRLGGFAKVEQLLEVYGMDSIWFETMKPSLRADSGAIRKISINVITQEELEKHPYLGRSVSKAICNYRQQHGSFTGLPDLKKIYIVDEAVLQKVSPYLAFE